MSDAHPPSSSKPLRDRNENQVSPSSSLSTIRYLTEQSQLGIGTVRTLIHLPRFLLSTKAWSVLLFGKSTVHPHGALEKGCSNRMHRFLSTNWQLLQLWWHMGVQKHFCCHLAVLSCALSLKKGEREALCIRRGRLDSTEIAEILIPVELQLVPSQLFPFAR